MNTLYSVPIQSLAPDRTTAWTLMHPSAEVVANQDILRTPMSELLPNATWFNITSLDYSPGPRTGGSSWVVNNMLYVFGGNLIIQRKKKDNERNNKGS